MQLSEPKGWDPWLCGTFLDTVASPILCSIQVRSQGPLPIVLHRLSKRQTEQKGVGCRTVSDGQENKDSWILPTKLITNELNQYRTTAEYLSNFHSSSVSNTATRELP